MAKIKSLIIHLIVPLAVGFLSSLLTRNAMKVYAETNQPSFAPPSILFPIVWTILYTLMGISSYIVSQSNSSLKRKSIYIYAIQLLVNFIWPIIFFNSKMYLFAFFWLLFLLALVLYMTILFNRINKISSYLQIPYILWLTFAAFLNFSVYKLN